MTDSLTESDVDRIYNRLKIDVNISKIKNKAELYKAVSSNPSTRSWNRKLNDFFWDLHTKSFKVVEEVPEIKSIPAKPRNLLTPNQKRQQTISQKRLIRISASNKQKSYFRGTPRRWKDSEINFALILKKDGLTYRQIGYQLSRSVSSISTKLSRFKR
jgi:hypothetical protein